MALQCFGCICIIIAHAILQQIWIDNMLSHDVPRRETDSLLLGMRAPKKDSLLLGMRAVLGAFRYEYIPNFSEARSISKKDFKLKIIIIILFKTDLLTDINYYIIQNRPFDRYGIRRLTRKQSFSYCELLRML